MAGPSTPDPSDGGAETRGSLKRAPSSPQLAPHPSKTAKTSHKWVNDTDDEENGTTDDKASKTGDAKAGGVQDVPPVSANQTPEQQVTSDQKTSADGEQDATADDKGESQLASQTNAPLTVALDPALLRPTSLTEQEINTLQVQNNNREYQLAVKDWQIALRDNNIQQKDEQIASLQYDLADKERALESWKRVQLAVSTEYRHIMVSAIERKDEELGELKATITRQTEELGGTHERAEKLDTTLRLLVNKYGAVEAEIAELKGRNVVSHVLHWLHGALQGREDGSQVQKTTFPLMKLSGELRNKIYKHALVLRRPIDLWPMIPPDAPQGTTYLQLIKRQRLSDINTALLRVSRQVHFEAVPILYGCNRFLFSEWSAWPVIGGFLFSIGSNCEWLTNISVGAPECFSQSTALRDEEKAREADVKGVLEYLFKMSPDSPLTPSLKPVQAYRRAAGVLMRLPSLKSVSIVIPHNACMHGIDVLYMVKCLTTMDEALYERSYERATEKFTRSFVFVRRSVLTPPRTRWINIDDHDAMGRTKLVTEATRLGATVLTAQYGLFANGISYLVDGGEAELDVNMPKWVSQPSPQPAVMTLLQAVARFFRR